jgi:hypothetical protein
MGEKTLVESQIADSNELIKYLDSSGYQPSFAVWYYYGDADEWRFLIAGEKLDGYLPKQEPLAYRVIAEAINEKNLSSINLSEIKIVRSDEPITQTVKFLVRTEPTGIVRAYFTDTTINGIFVKEMVILRSA